METQSPKYTVEVLSSDTMHWYVNTACVNMLMYELNRPELVDIETIQSLCSQMEAQGSGWVVKANGEPVGALGGLITNNLFNPRFKQLVELFWYVLPDHRNTRAGVLLFNEFNKFGEENANEATLSLLTSSEVNIGSMEKRGFEFTEFGFVKRYK